MKERTFQLELIPGQDIFTIIPLLRQLNTEIPVKTLEERLEDMVNQGYQCLGVYDKGKLIGVSGLWILTKYYVGKHIEPDNVVIHPDYRGSGIGKMMMDWITEYGKSIGCEASELNCYVSNDKGVKFWINSGYRIIGYHFQKKWI
ncbi:GNAT family N-acetyltransferase [Sinomicrobium sp. M5D2P17]